MSSFPIFHVITDQWGPYVDIRACLKSRESRAKRTFVITPEQCAELPTSTLDNPDAFFIHWQPERAELGLASSAAKHAAVFSEAYDDDPAKLLPDHRVHLERFLAQRDKFDCVFAHTPKLAARLQGPSTPAFVLPVGWDAEAMGAPRWDAPKHYSIEFHGSMVGRRMGAWLGDANGCGLYGRMLLGYLDQSAISLYKAHSDVMSFSTWRLWQCASTSCVLAADSASEDSWPFYPDEHYIKLAPGFDPSELVALAREPAWLMLYARRAHELAREFSIDRIEKAYIVTAFERLKEH